MAAQETPERLDLIGKLLEHTRVMVTATQEGTKAMSESAAALQRVTTQCESCRAQCDRCLSGREAKLIKLIWALVLAIMVLAGAEVGQLTGLIGG